MPFKTLFPALVFATLTTAHGALAQPALVPADEAARATWRPAPDAVIGRLASISTPLESIDVQARTVSARSYKIAPGTTPARNGTGGLRVQMVPGDVEVVPIAPDVVIERPRQTIGADGLSLGDTVALLGQKAPEGTVKLVVPQSTTISHRVGTGSARYSLNARFFKVISLAPLLLRRGGEPEAEEIVNVPFTNGPDATTIGTLSVARSQRAANDTEATKTSDDGLVVTLHLTNAKDLEFDIPTDKFTKPNLATIAAELAAGKISVRPEYQVSKDGKKQVKRLVVTDTR